LGLYIERFIYYLIVAKPMVEQNIEPKKKRNITLGLGLICLSVGLLAHNVWTSVTGGILAIIGYMGERR
jgi:hypothetical protein